MKDTATVRISVGRYYHWKRVARTSAPAIDPPEYVLELTPNEADTVALELQQIAAKQRKHNTRRIEISIVIASAGDLDADMREWICDGLSGIDCDEWHLRRIDIVRHWLEEAQDWIAERETQRGIE